MEILLTQGYVALVDPEDAELLNFKWNPLKTKTNVYANRLTKSSGTITHHLMHVIIFERVIGRSLCQGELVDHIDGNGLNNMKINLRLATYSQNGMNSKLRKDSKSGFKGVSWDQNKQKWAARISINKKQLRLGYFETAQEAYAIYCAAAKQQYGEFARLE